MDAWICWVWVQTAQSLSCTCGYLRPFSPLEIVVGDGDECGFGGFDVLLFAGGRLG